MFYPILYIYGILSNVVNIKNIRFTNIQKEKSKWQHVFYSHGTIKVPHRGLFARIIHHLPVNSPRKGPIMNKVLHCITSLRTDEFNSRLCYPDRVWFFSWSVNMDNDANTVVDVHDISPVLYDCNQRWWPTNLLVSSVGSCQPHFRNNVTRRVHDLRQHCCAIHLRLINTFGIYTRSCMPGLESSQR